MFHDVLEANKLPDAAVLLRLRVGLKCYKRVWQFSNFNNVNYLIPHVMVVTELVWTFKTHTSCKSHSAILQLLHLVQLSFIDFYQSTWVGFVERPLKCDYDEEDSESILPADVELNMG